MFKSVNFFKFNSSHNLTVKKVGYRRDIQVLRGISVLWVVLYHLQVPGFQNGLLGVDVFFVISGFLMGEVYKGINPISFILRRAKRLLPAYLFVVCSVCLLGSLILVHSDFLQLLEQCLFSLGLMSNVGFWLQTSYFDYEAFNPLMNLWSLGVEIQYYLLLSFLFPFIKNRLWLLYLLLAGSLLAALIVTTVSPKTAFFILPFRVWEFFLGYLAWFYGRDVKYSVNQSQALVLMASLFLFLLFPLQAGSVDLINGHIGLFTIGIALFTSMLLLRPMAPIQSSNNVLVRLLAGTGERSYSVYLAHFPVVIMWNYEPFGGTKLGFENGHDLFVIVLLMWGFTWFLYKWIEPTRNLDFKWASVVSIIVTSLGVVACSFWINKAQFSNAELKIFDAWNDRSYYRCGKIFRLLNPTEKICTLNAEKSHGGIFLVGNSHADAIKMSVANVFKERGQQVHFHVSNQPLMNSNVGHADVVDAAVNRKVDAVLFHYSLSFFDSDERRKSLIKTMSGLKSLGIPSFLLTPVPGYDYHIPKALYKTVKRGKVELLGMRVDDYRRDNDAFFSMLNQEVVSKYTLIHSEEALCPNEQCLISLNGRPLYFDAGHLTLSGAKLLEPVLKNAFVHGSGGL